MTLEVSIYGVWFLPNEFCRYYWDSQGDWTNMGNSGSHNPFEIIRVASPTNIQVKKACNINFIEVIEYFQDLFYEY